MKTAIFAVMLTMSGVVLAQDMQQPATGATTVAPANTAPARDARGIAVISDPAQAPAGFNQPPQVGGTGVPANATPTPQAATENYPTCSRTVTDHCVQAYERGARAPRR